MAFAHDIHTAHAGFAGRVVSFFKAVAARYEQYRLEQRTFNELNALGDRELDDLGLNRSMLRAVAAEAATHR